MREAAEVHVRRLQNELKDSQAQVAEGEQRFISMQKAKDNLEIELTRLADETEAPQSFAKLQRQYESKISQLEQQLEDWELSKSAAARIKEHVDRQHAEIRRLIMSSGPKDDSFRNRLLRELQLADEEMERELSHRSQTRHLTGNRTGEQTMANVTPTKPRSNGTVRFKDTPTEIPRTPERRAQVDKLRQQVQALELQMAASQRIRQYLETSLREVTEELQNSDGSKQSVEACRARLAKENAKLAELLQEEAEARRAAHAAQLDGVQAMWERFQTTISQERESYTRLEESRKALVVQQRAAQIEVEDQRRQVQELSAAKKQLQSEVTTLKERLDAEILAKNDEISIKRSLQSRLQELEITSSATATIHSELQEAIEAYKTKTDEYLKRYEEAEINRAKAARAEAFARRALADAEKSHGQIVAERQAAEQKLQAAEERVKELERKLEEEGRESSDLELLRQRLAEEMEDERKQHQQDLAERDFVADQTRKKYQAELAQLSEELQSQRDTMSRLREESRKLRSEYDQLQLRYDDEVYNGGSWKKDKERLETKIQDLTQAYDASVAAQAEQQSQIVSLHSQVRELRSVLNDAETDRALLQKARRALQAELEAIKLDHADTNRMSSDTELQRLRLEKQDLERSLEEQGDRVAMAFERMKKAEGYANECQIELGKIRVENSELDKMNANLEKQVKDLNLRIVDLETRSLNPRPAPTSRRLESRIEELTSQLTQSNKESSRIHVSADKALAEAERQRARLEEEVKNYELKIDNMRQKMDQLVRGYPSAPTVLFTYCVCSKLRRTTCSSRSGVPSGRRLILSKSRWRSSARLSGSGHAWNGRRARCWARL
ncbi:hypothetical protein BD413DRAFT_718 [Trametes elegans]|nr:hypothetical protein BD413DRAFT_718 [Trametes elegans]